MSLRFALLFVPVLLCGQTSGLPYDWSSRHVVFPQPASEEVRRQLEADPRYAQQNLRRARTQFAPRDTAPAADPAADWNEAVGTSPYNLTSPTYPAKYSFNAAAPTPDCANDYVVYTLPVASSNDFNVIAFNHLYPGLCAAGSVPSVLFAYNGSQSAGTLSTAPVLSLDGTAIAFIEKSNGARFHVLRWRAGDKSSVFPRPFNSSGLPNCTTNAAPCEYSVSYSTATSTLGSPFIDYAADVAYVTDDKGYVSAIGPVFHGTPANPPRVLAGYPVKVGSSAMTAPVYDSVSGNVFVSDSTQLYYLRTRSTSSGSCLTGTAVPCAGRNSIVISAGAGMGSSLEAPIVDSTNGTVFVFAWSGPPYNGDTIVQSNTTLTVHNVAEISGARGGSVPSRIFAGTFDNAYYNSPVSGKLYACGENDSGHQGTLWAVGFSSASAMKAGLASFGPLALARRNPGGPEAPCSSLTEVYNQTAGKDFLYMGITSNCAFMDPDDGCIAAFDITSAFPSTAKATFPVIGGSSGIIVDNVSGALGSTNNIYFLTTRPLETPCRAYTGGATTNGNCAVKLTQTQLR